MENEYFEVRDTSGALHMAVAARKVLDAGSLAGSGTRLGLPAYSLLDGERLNPGRDTNTFIGLQSKQEYTRV